MRRTHSGSSFEPAYGFCRAVRQGDRILVAGTAPIPQDGSATPPGAFDQAVLCGEIMRAAINQLADDAVVVRTRMFITDPSDADDVGRAHKQLFGSDEPAATMVVVAALLDPAWKVEMECEAVVTALDD